MGRLASLSGVLLLLLGGCHHDPGGSLPAGPPEQAAPAPGAALVGEGHQVVVDPPVAPPEAWRADVCSADPGIGSSVNRERLHEANRGRPRGVIAVEAIPAEGTEATAATEADLRVLRRGHGRLVRCYAVLLRERPALAGSLSFTLRLTPEGRVEATDLRPESELPGALVRCLEGVLGGLRFEPGPGTRRVEGRLRLTP